MSVGQVEQVDYQQRFGGGLPWRCAGRQGASRHTCSRMPAPAAAHGMQAATEGFSAVQWRGGGGGFGRGLDGEDAVDEAAVVGGQATDAPGETRETWSGKKVKSALCCSLHNGDTRVAAPRMCTDFPAAPQREGGRSAGALSASRPARGDAETMRRSQPELIIDR